MDEALKMVLDEHSTLLREIRDETHKTNGRVTKHDTLIARLLLAVFGGGPLLVGAVAYLYNYILHLPK